MYASASSMYFGAPLFHSTMLLAFSPFFLFRAFFLFLFSIYSICRAEYGILATKRHISLLFVSIFSVHSMHVLLEFQAHSNELMPSTFWYTLRTLNGTVIAHVIHNLISQRLLLLFFCLRLLCSAHAPYQMPIRIRNAIDHSTIEIRNIYSSGVSWTLFYLRELFDITSHYGTQSTRAVFS